jgi:flagellar export protein FliJ
VKSYRFPLATVLRIRLLQERLARETFMLAQRDLRAAEEVRREAHERLAALAGPGAVTSIDEVRWLADQAERLARALREADEALTAAIAHRGEANSAWHVARRRAGALERLDDKAIARWRDEMTRVEVAELDDLANARHGAPSESS